MQRFLFIFLLIFPLWVCPSCEEEDGKRPPGTKPEILFGKWQTCQDLYSFLVGPKIGLYWKTYEFTSKGGSITTLEYITKEDEYREPSVILFTDWCYDGECIEFLRRESNGTYFRWGIYIEELTPSSIRLGGTRYYKINE